MIVIMMRSRGEAILAKTAKEGGTTPIVGLAFFVPNHLASCGINCHLIVAIASPIDNYVVTIHGPVRVRRILLANKVVCAVCVKLDLLVNSRGVKLGK
jgi:hypothetical protein